MPREKTMKVVFAFPTTTMAMKMEAAAKAKEVELGSMNLDHVVQYTEELEKAGLHTGEVSPMLLPNYARHEQR